MEYPDHPYPSGIDSYPPSEVVLNYYQTFVAKFGLRDYIKFNHLVIRCQPIEDDRWELIVKDLPSNRFDTLTFDAVIVANGHHVTPRIPKLPGQNLFKGRVLHSHDYRTTEAFKGKLAFLSR